MARNVRISGWLLALTSVVSYANSNNLVSLGDLLIATNPWCILILSRVHLLLDLVWFLVCSDVPHQARVCVLDALNLPDEPLSLLALLLHVPLHLSREIQAIGNSLHLSLEVMGVVRLQAYFGR